MTAFAPVRDAAASLTPELVRDAGPTQLLLVDLGGGRDRLGGSALAQVFEQVGDEAPDLDDPAALRGLAGALCTLRERGLVLAYHDRSDGGLLACCVEMAFAGGTGVRLDLDVAADRVLPALFAEELGAVLQVRDRDLEEVRTVLASHGLGEATRALGAPAEDDHVTILCDGEPVFHAARSALRAAWSATTWQMQRLRDDPTCADEEQAARCEPAAPGLHAHVPFALDGAPAVHAGPPPRMAILREQGVNGQVEMAAAFHRAGFECVDVHMSDLLGGRRSLAEFRGLVACGGNGPGSRVTRVFGSEAGPSAPLRTTSTGRSASSGRSHSTSSEWISESCRPISSC